jgi:hypothetical protein
MSDRTAEAFDRLDHLHRQWPMPTTCVACRTNATTSADGICGPCRCDIRSIQLWSSE